MYQDNLSPGYDWRSDYSVFSENKFFNQIIHEIDNENSDFPCVRGVTEKLKKFMIDQKGFPDCEDTWEMTKYVVAAKLVSCGDLPGIHEKISGEAKFNWKFGKGNQIECWNMAEQAVAHYCLHP
jgi:hypothetical protein